jgi:hypothetical protein
MEHWDGRDRDQAAELRISRQDRRRLAQFFQTQPPRRRQRSFDSVVGLVISLGMLAVLVWALAPDSPVSPEVMR